MIERPDKDNVLPDPDSIKRQTAAARAVVDYCLDISECRRVQILHYFDERFDRMDCGRGCDDYAHPLPLVTRDVTREASCAVELVKAFQAKAELVTLAHCRDVLKGSKTAAIRARQHDKLPLHGSTRDMPSELLEQMFRRLCLMDILSEDSVMQASGFHIEYVVVSHIDLNKGTRCDDTGIRLVL
jgi:superfamily II DNA helicase RecQ